LENILPGDFIDQLVEKAENTAKKQIFLRGCLITDERPDVKQIVMFLKHVESMSKNKKILK